MKRRDPLRDYSAINKETRIYNLRLMERPQIIVANKMDMPESQETLLRKIIANYDEFEELPPIFPTLGLTKAKGLAPLLGATAELLDKTLEFPIYDESWNGRRGLLWLRWRRKPLRLVVTMMQLSSCQVKTAETLNMTNFDESVSEIWASVARYGELDEALRARGAKDGDLNRIGKFEFEFVD